ncbi:hypothetical protein MUO14_04265 [Halobacillus shinanisalinarum]|uniref:Uncharacterized protein n=1 Tax=Halobacillus shinanisalinarum TaxID=2932258 RepID=A0ABY4H1Y2_9BACI|nr:hypothetical protein [Halobacillus shinanisalinarum]UOQ94188.1 hypothetical protein MUO14_04265 [Halobacillus shinanisalinarum]
MEDKQSHVLVNKYTFVLLFIPAGFYLLSLGEDASKFQHICLNGMIIILAVMGVLAATGKSLFYGVLCLAAALLLTYMSLVLIW